MSNILTRELTFDEAKTVLGAVLHFDVDVLDDKIIILDDGREIDRYQWGIEKYDLFTLQGIFIHHSWIHRETGRKYALAKVMAALEI